MNRTDETLTWILGTPVNWISPWSDKLLSPVGDVIWPFHQHAVEISPNGLGLGLYDNGNYRAEAYEPWDEDVTEYSRAVIYSIDDDAMTVSEVWSYGDSSGENSFFSPGMGDADWQPETGNVVMANSELVDGTITYGQILEVTPDGTRVYYKRLAPNEPKTSRRCSRGEIRKRVAERRNTT